MLDPKLLRDNPDKIRKMLEARAVDFPLDQLIKIDKERRDLIIKTDELRKKRNEISLEVARKKKANGDATKLIEQMQSVSEELSKLEGTQIKADELYTKLSLSLPNLIHDSVPIGRDVNANKEIKKWEKPPIFDFKIRDHIELTQSLDLVDLERAAKVAGARFYYLKNKLVKLNQSLIQFSLDFLSDKNYTLVQTPYLINRSSMEGAIIAQDFEDVIYKVEGEDLYLIGTSEHAVASMHSDEIIDGKNLPLRYAGISPCFRKEAGAHGRDQKGIFRVHQFDKVEQFIFSRPEESWNEHERLLSLVEEFYQKIELPYRIMLLSSSDLGKVSAKTYDLEAWIAGQNSYREIVSCSNCLDFQARRLKIRFRDRTDEQPQYLHTLNSTLVATTRTMVAIMENFQTKDGHVAVPKVLQKYVGASTI
ncbi:MAG: serine--tRNA ligase [Thaumarchaeota archaeon 13_1_40CM_4_38_7]|nr:MAG: serine--tRNA ligase [Thaumarchaeota archaeon 13_1_40CM_4_38_7]OLC91754.1 MAG: serine--tRNA ligase [Thaumarchaeota archaeon 13_1_40CM_3_38_6]OLD40557.1 MAG: serine--tRNA ligase [Thaumarchaeota archaeon 13_1_40CM_2_39_4]